MVVLGTSPRGEMCAGLATQAVAEAGLRPGRCAAVGRGSAGQPRRPRALPPTRRSEKLCKNIRTFGSVSKPNVSCFWGSPIAAAGVCVIVSCTGISDNYFFLQRSFLPKWTQRVFWSAFPRFDHLFCRSVFMFRGTAGYVMNANVMHSEINV